MTYKTRVAYEVQLWSEHNTLIHSQYIMPNELHLIATFFKAHPETEYIKIFKDNLSTEHWLFS
jgi:hypothetical protein